MVGEKLPRSSPSVELIVLDFDTEKSLHALWMARWLGMRGGGRAGRAAFLILSSVTLEESNAGGLTGAAVSDESPRRSSRLAHPRDSRSGGERARRDTFLILSPVI